MLHGASALADDVSVPDETIGTTFPQTVGKQSIE